jgi:hypothetical protein
MLFNLRNLDVAGVPQDAESRQKPDDHADNDDDIEDLLDLPVHGNVGVDEPEQYADDDESYYKGNHLQPFVYLVRLFSMDDNIVEKEVMLWGLYPM